MSRNIKDKLSVYRFSDKALASGRYGVDAETRFIFVDKLHVIFFRYDEDDSSVGRVEALYEEKTLDSFCTLANEQVPTSLSVGPDDLNLYMGSAHGVRGEMSTKILSFFAKNNHSLCLNLIMDMPNPAINSVCSLCCKPVIVTEDVLRVFRERWRSFHADYM